MFCFVFPLCVGTCTHRVLFFYLSGSVYYYYYYCHLYPLVKSGPYKKMTICDGLLQRAFEDAAFGLQIGGVSGVVSTDSGMHLIMRTA